MYIVRVFCSCITKHHFRMMDTMDGVTLILRTVRNVPFAHALQAIESFTCGVLRYKLKKYK